MVVKEACESHTNREGRNGENLQDVWVWKVRSQAALSISVLKRQQEGEHQAETVLMSLYFTCPELGMIRC